MSDQDRTRARRGVVPGVVPVEQVIARTVDVAIHLSCFWVYPTGIRFTLIVDLRDEWSGLDPFQFGPHRAATGAESDDREPLKLGFSFADGTKATYLGMRSLWAGEDSESPSLSSSSASSSNGHSARPFWLRPLPPPGPFAVVCEWPAAGIALTRCELDSSAIAAAAARAQTIFDDGREAID